MDTVRPWGRAVFFYAGVGRRMAGWAVEAESGRGGQIGRVC